MILFEADTDATLPALADLRKRARRALDDLRLPEPMRDALELAIAEGGANPVFHANPKPARLKVTVLGNSRGVETIIEDDGGFYDGFDAALAAISGMPDLMAEAGRGLPLMKEAMDRITYSRHGGVNRLSLFRRHLRRRLKILLAEDSDATMALFVAVLGDRHDLVTARSVAEMADRIRPDLDLIVSDLHLGDGKASDVLRALEASREGLQVPVILITSDTSDAVVNEAVRLGIETVLAKPVRPKALNEAIDKALAAQARQRMNQARQFNRMIEDIVGRPAIQPVDGFNTAWRCGTAATGGGDLLVDLGGIGRRRIVMADLMGHGVSARARSATWSGLLRGVQIGSEAQGPHVFVNRFSAALCRDDLPDHVTGTLLVIDLLDDGGIEMASAGHPAPLVLGGGVFTPLNLSGPLPGLSETVCDAPLKLRLKTGERLIAATDGVDPESLAYRLELPEKVRHCAIAMAQASIDTMAGAMAEAIDCDSGYRPDDDWTILIVEASADQPLRR